MAWTAEVHEHASTIAAGGDLGALMADVATWKKAVNAYERAWLGFPELFATEAPSCQQEGWECPSCMQLKLHLVGIARTQTAEAPSLVGLPGR